MPAHNLPSEPDFEERATNNGRRWRGCLRTGSRWKDSDECAVVKVKDRRKILRELYLRMFLLKAQCAVINELGTGTCRISFEFDFLSTLWALWLLTFLFAVSCKSIEWILRTTSILEIWITVHGMPENIAEPGTWRAVCIERWKWLGVRTVKDLISFNMLVSLPAPAPRRGTGVLPKLLQGRFKIGCSSSNPRSSSTSGTQNLSLAPLNSNDRENLLFI